MTVNILCCEHRGCVMKPTEARIVVRRGASIEVCPSCADSLNPNRKRKQAKAKAEPRPRTEESGPR